jgi:hypothetical protein
MRSSAISLRSSASPAVGALLDDTQQELVAFSSATSQ